MHTSSCGVPANLPPGMLPKVCTAYGAVVDGKEESRGTIGSTEGNTVLASHGSVSAEGHRGHNSIIGQEEWLLPGATRTAMGGSW